MTKVSPIAEYIRANKVIPKHDKFGCHLYTPEGMYVARITKAVVNNYKVINVEAFGEGLKKLYTKSIAIGQQYIYLKNNDSKIGLSLVPIKTYMRKIFVDFLERKSYLEDTERTLSNKLNLIAIDENTGVGLYDTNKPFIYKTQVNNTQQNDLKNSRFKHTIH